MSTDNAPTLAHLIIPLMGMLIPIVAIVAHYLAKAYGERQRHETLREFARAGQPVPAELLAEAGERDDNRSSDARRATRVGRGPDRILLPAVVNVGLGMGAGGMFAVMSPQSWLWGLGLLPLGLGLCLLGLWAYLRRQAGDR